MKDTLTPSSLPEFFWLAERPEWAYPSPKHANRANLKALKEKYERMTSLLITAQENDKWFLYWWLSLLNEEIKRFTLRLSDNPLTNLDAIRAISIERVLKDLGVERRYDSYLCPFHNDRTPGSFKVFKKTNSCWCYSCQKGGSVIDLVVDKLQVSIGEAIKWLKNHY